MPSLDSMMMREIIMDHYENPRNHGLVDDKKYDSVNMDSETCIDNIDVQALVEDGVIKDIRFDGEACAICTASTSIMSELLIGKTVEEATRILKESKLNIKVEGENGIVVSQDPTFDVEVEEGTVVNVVIKENLQDGQ